MQEENQLAVAAEPQTTTDPPVTEQQPEGGEGQQQQQQTQEQQPPQQRQVSSDVEARARDMGWRPQNEWRGAPDAWRPADEFLRRGEEVLPIVRSRAQRAEAEVANLRSRMDDQSRDFEDRLRRLDRVSQVALQNQARQIGQHYQTLMREAAAKGDLEGYDALNRQYAADYDDLQRSAAEAYQAPAQPQHQQPQPVDPEVVRTVQAWIDRNDWWHRDPEMQRAATNYHGYLQNTQRMALEDNLAEVDRYLRGTFPDRFKQANGTGQRPPQQQQTAHAPAMEAGTRQPAGAGRTKGWNELPPEAKRAGEKFIGQELYTNDAKGRAEYAADYWSQE